MSPSDLIEELPVLLAMRRPVFIHGPSGVGKSACVHQVANIMKRKLNDMRASQLDSIDVRGFPMPDAKKGQMTYLPSEDMPRESDPPGILFLDELNGAMPSVASALYQLILDHRIGQYVLPKHWSIVAAGNRMNDRGVTHQMPAPLNNRFVHIDFDVSPNDWHKRAAIDEIHPHIRAYLRLKPGALHIYDPVQNPRSFPTPRSWYFVDEIYKSGRRPGPLFELMKGTIGEGAAAEFKGFVADLEHMPNIDSILIDPKKAPLPGNLSATHTVITTLSDKAKASSYPKLMLYVERLPREFQMVFNQLALGNDINIQNTKTYTDWCIANEAILN